MTEPVFLCFRPKGWTKINIYQNSIFLFINFAQKNISLQDIRMNECTRRKIFLNCGTTYQKYFKTRAMPGEAADHRHIRSPGPVYSGRHPMQGTQVRHLGHRPFPSGQQKTLQHFGIHRNILLYRLNQVEQIAEINLTDS